MFFQAYVRESMCDVMLPHVSLDDLSNQAKGFYISEYAYALHRHDANGATFVVQI